MVIQGVGMSDLTIKIKEGYSIDTKIALEWFKASDNNDYATDWTSASDYYESSIKTYGNETYINNIAEQFNSFRVAGNYNLILSQFAEDEYIFGQDLDYTSVSAYLMEYFTKESTSWKGYTCSLKLRAVNPQFTTYPEWSWNSNCIDHKWKGDRNFDIKNYDTYDSNVYFYDHYADEGNCEFTISINNNDLASLRQFRRTQRGNYFTLPAMGLGVVYPFGINSGSGNHYVKLMDMKEKRISPMRSLVEIKLSEFIE